MKSLGLLLSTIPFVALIFVLVLRKILGWMEDRALDPGSGSADLRHSGQRAA